MLFEFDGFHSTWSQKIFNFKQSITIISFLSFQVKKITERILFELHPLKCVILPAQYSFSPFTLSFTVEQFSNGFCSPRRQKCSIVCPAQQETGNYLLGESSIFHTSSISYCSVHIIYARLLSRREILCRGLRSFHIENCTNGVYLFIDLVTVCLLL